MCQNRFQEWKLITKKNIAVGNEPIDKAGEMSWGHDGEVMKIKLL